MHVAAGHTPPSMERHSPPHHCCSPDATALILATHAGGHLPPLCTDHRSPPLSFATSDGPPFAASHGPLVSSRPHHAAQSHRPSIDHLRSSPTSVVCSDFPFTSHHHLFKASSSSQQHFFHRHRRHRFSSSSEVFIFFLHRRCQSSHFCSLLLPSPVFPSLLTTATVVAIVLVAIPIAGSGSTSMSGRKKRGCTRGIGLSKINKALDKKMKINISTKEGRSTNAIQSAKLSNELGMIARNILPIKPRWIKLTEVEMQIAFDKLEIEMM
ncbi:uncharacterized protein [Elaeis guineensis]|uniref:uncharacterized protein isoform X2 n=1 Tax=Elaeis guineensis var. tenera TaxID=51953 RepID=UPI003C6D047B